AWRASNIHTNARPAFFHRLYLPVRTHAGKWLHLFRVEHFVETKQIVLAFASDNESEVDRQDRVELRFRVVREYKSAQEEMAHFEYDERIQGQLVLKWGLVMVKVTENVRDWRKLKTFYQATIAETNLMLVMKLLTSHLS